MKRIFLLSPLLILLIALGLWAFWLEPSSFITTTTDIKLRRWPASCNGLKIIVLSDVHVGSPHNGIANLAKVVEATNAIHTQT
ncbi:MAG: hypothetical protein EXR80_03840 [Methylococcales bacterium]|nr:hypothetical protein [Methylococcales bacterium]